MQQADQRARAPTVAAPQVKVPRFDSAKLRDAARGRPCVLCEHDLVDCTETTVLAHLPGAFYAMPAGWGEKTHDWLGAHLCSDHHERMDNEWRRNPHMRLMALCLTLQRLFAEGVIVVA